MNHFSSTGCVNRGEAGRTPERGAGEVTAHLRPVQAAGRIGVPRLNAFFVTRLRTWNEMMLQIYIHVQSKRGHGGWVRGQTKGEHAQLFVCAAPPLPVSFRRAYIIYELPIVRRTPSNEHTTRGLSVLLNQDMEGEELEVL